MGADARRRPAAELRLGAQRVEDDPFRRVGAAKALLYLGPGRGIEEFDTALRREKDEMVRIEMLDHEGRSIFGAIEQVIEPYA